MPKICYTPKRFGGPRLTVIEKANEIIAEYHEQGFELTLRQIFYQFVSRGLIENSQREYKNLGETLNDARLAGYVDWNAMVDRTRNLQGVTAWESPSQIIESCSRSFHLSRWKTQPYRPECWVEKDALVGVIEKACSGMDVDFFSCRGYTSQSELWNAAMRLKRYMNAGQIPLVIHLGDHDPSGKDMTRDIEDRIRLFVGKRVEIRRIALNMDQIRQYNPPPNPAKTTDSRYANYIREFGEESWELDALEPRVITDMIRSQLDGLIDREAWQKVEKEEAKHRKKLDLISKRYLKLIKKLR